MFRALEFRNSGFGSVDFKSRGFYRFSFFGSELWRFEMPGLGCTASGLKAQDRPA